MVKCRCTGTSQTQTKSNEPAVVMLQEAAIRETYDRKHAQALISGKVATPASGEGAIFNRAQHVKLGAHENSLDLASTDNSVVVGKHIERYVQHVSGKIFKNGPLSRDVVVSKAVETQQYQSQSVFLDKLPSNAGAFKLAVGSQDRVYMDMQGIGKDSVIEFSKAGGSSGRLVLIAGGTGADLKVQYDAGSGTATVKDGDRTFTVKGLTAPEDLLVARGSKALSDGFVADVGTEALRTQKSEEARGSKGAPPSEPSKPEPQKGSGKEPPAGKEDPQAVELRKRVEKLERDLKQRDKEIADRDERLKKQAEDFAKGKEGPQALELQKRVEKLEEDLRKKDDLLKQRDKELAERDAIIKKQAEDLAKATAELAKQAKELAKVQGDMEVLKKQLELLTKGQGNGESGSKPPPPPESPKGSSPPPQPPKEGAPPPKSEKESKKEEPKQPEPAKPTLEGKLKDLAELDKKLDQAEAEKKPTDEIRILERRREKLVIEAISLKFEELSKQGELLQKKLDEATKSGDHTAIEKAENELEAFNLKFEDFAQAPEQAFKRVKKESPGGSGGGGAPAPKPQEMSKPSGSGAPKPQEMPKPGGTEAPKPQESSAQALEREMTAKGFVVKDAKYPGFFGRKMTGVSEGTFFQNPTTKDEFAVVNGIKLDQRDPEYGGFLLATQKSQDGGEFYDYVHPTTGEYLRAEPSFGGTYAVRRMMGSGDWELLHIRLASDWSQVIRAKGDFENGKWVPFDEAALKSRGFNKQESHPTYGECFIRELPKDRSDSWHVYLPKSGTFVVEKFYEKAKDDWRLSAVYASSMGKEAVERRELFNRKNFTQSARFDPERGKYRVTGYLYGFASEQEDEVKGE